MTLLERLNERWEHMDGAAARKIDRILKERREAATEIERLRAAIARTLRENGHLADGDACTLIHLKRAIAPQL